MSHLSAERYGRVLHTFGLFFMSGHYPGAKRKSKTMNAIELRKGISFILCHAPVRSSNRIDGCSRSKGLQ
ncbi:MAG: hypothetical protein ACOY90_04890 [Candidatus Zhuqueibacterota bacterium]